VRGAPLLRPGLLDGAQLAVAGPADAALAGATRELCGELGAVLAEPGDGAAMLAIDCDGLMAESGELAGCMSAAWELTREHAQPLIAESRPGRIFYLAPRDDVAVAALENLARTLSIEWARNAITTVAIAPGGETSAAEVAALVAYLASRAGEYFSGCLLDLRGPR